MIARARSLVLLTRPPVLFLLVVYAALGLARHALLDDHLAVARCVAVCVGTLLFAVALNDLADVAVDQVNLPGDVRRPLATGALRRLDVLVAGTVGAVAALVAAALSGWVALTVVGGGLVLAAAYSLPPLRLSARGVVAPLVLPACYVAVPFLTGVLQAGRPDARDVLTLVALYVGFVGRIVLKDFRDVRGDALFGKRTFLVRHGRRATCLLSAAFWGTGGLLLVATTRPASAAYVCVTLTTTAAALGLLRALSVSDHPRTDERLVSALAIVGRSTLVLTLLQLGLPRAPWAPWTTLALACVLALQTVTMVRSGPSPRRLGRRDRRLLADSAAVVDLGAGVETPREGERLVQRLAP